MRRVEKGQAFSRSSLRRVFLDRIGLQRWSRNDWIVNDWDWKYTMRTGG